VSVHGWLTDDRVKPLGDYTARNRAVTLDETRIRSYIAAWRSHNASALLYPGLAPARSN